jgi:D-arabinose 5-phosphate isomerase GutQ
MAKIVTGADGVEEEEWNKKIRNVRKKQLNVFVQGMGKTADNARKYKKRVNFKK